VTDPVVRVTGLAKRFHGIRDRRGEVVALAGVSLTVEPGEVLGIVGESGSGKTTLARCLAALTMPSQGSIEVCGVTWTDRLNREGRRKLARNLQLVFQDPYTSLSPRMRTGSLIGEGLRVHHLSTSRADERDRVARLMTSVGLGSELARSYPRELSGGQRQRVALARALALDPKVLVLDEPVSSLDVSIQAQILNLLRDLTAQREMSTVIISHDLAVIRFSCHRVIVMCDGAIVEEGDVEDILAAPEHPYTRELIASVPGAPRPGGRAPAGAVPRPRPALERNPQDVADELPGSGRRDGIDPAVSRGGNSG
jgi:ABC-type glutathione transport system ATPase component